MNECIAMASLDLSATFEGKDKIEDNGIFLQSQSCKQNHSRPEFLFLTSHENYKVGKNKISNGLNQLSGEKI